VAKHGDGLKVNQHGDGLGKVKECQMGLQYHYSICALQA